MKIKRERQVRLDELITYIIKNEVISSVFVSNRGNKTIVDTKGDFSHFGVFNQTDLFTITEEVEITEDVKLKQILTISKKNYINRFSNTSLNKIMKQYETASGLDVPLKFIYLQNDDGSIGELIWKDGGMVD